jgi:hypothetical protein
VNLSVEVLRSRTVKPSGCRSNCILGIVVTSQCQVYFVLFLFINLL